MTGRARNLTLRLPQALHEHLANSAKARGKSLNTEIVERLRYTFRDPSYQPPEQADLDDLRERLAVIERVLFGHDPAET